MHAGLESILKQLVEKQENQEKSSHRTHSLSTFSFVQIPAQNKIRIIITKTIMITMIIPFLRAYSVPGSMINILCL